MSETPTPREVAYAALQEIRDIPPFSPTADIDLVWVVTAPGTYNTTAQTGIYADRWPSADRERIDYGIQLVQQITALRLKKPIENRDSNDVITKTEIQLHGPKLFYNGEDAATHKVAYLQNEQLELAATRQSFPIPQQNLIISHIETISTPIQVQDLAVFLQQHAEFKKIAVVTHVAHSTRVGRYLEHYRTNFPSDVTLLNAALPETYLPTEIILSELHKIEKYFALQYLSSTPWAGF